MTKADAEFAIVVIGRNEGERLRACLSSVFETTRNVVYADSASTDGSAELARSMGAMVVELDASMPLNAARGRNGGLAVVRRDFPGCDYVQFIDGDCRLEPDWCRIAVGFLEEHPRAAVACGRRFEAHPDASFYNRLADQEWNTPIGRASACGGDAMMRISALEEVGGFNSSLMASEEPELAARLRHAGWEVWRLDAPMTEHDAKIFTLAQWWRRTTRSGYGYAQAWLATRDLAERVNGRLLRSAVLWVIGVPTAVLFIAIVSGRPATLLLLPATYVLQIVRLALRRSRPSIQSLRVSAFLMLAKVPELVGAARAILARRTPAMIEYKMPTESRKS